MWDLPRPGLAPTSPPLAGGFLTTAPPGKSLNSYSSICAGECAIGAEIADENKIETTPALMEFRRSREGGY